MAKSLINVTKLVADLELEKIASVVQESLDAGVEPLKVHQAMSLDRIRWMLEAVEKFGRYPLTEKQAA